MKQIIFGRIEKKDGKCRPVFANKKHTQEVWDSMEGREFQTTWTKREYKRSILQNNFYWGVVCSAVQQGLWAQGMRTNLSETHELLKHRFRKKELVNEATGEVFEYTGSTTDMSKFEFMEYIKSIQEFSATFLGIVIPSPGEQLTITE